MAENGNGTAKPRKQPQDFKKKQPTTRKIYICMDSELAEEYESAQQTFAFAQMMASGDNVTDEQKKDLADAKAKVMEMQAIALEASQEFKFRSIGRVAYDTLVDMYPPTEAEKAAAIKGGDDPEQLTWSPEEFPPALMKASMVVPEMTHEEIDEMWTSPDWSANDLLSLFQTAMEAQMARRTVNLGNV